MPPTASTDQAAPGDGANAVDRRSWRTIALVGSDAVAWCGDLLTADIAGLSPGEATRSLLLTPTGRIRADVTVYRRADDLLLVQDPTQPAPVDTLLAPYVLSSDVRLEAVSIGPICLFPGARPPQELAEELATWRPGQLTPPVGGRGADLLIDRDAPIPAGLRIVDEAAADRWRIGAGIARFGPDLDERSFPAEAGLDRPDARVIDAAKGCFLGQESVAKIRNFGHPRALVVAARSRAGLLAGTPVTADGEPVGLVTSTAPGPEGSGSVAIVRIDWTARGGPLVAASAPLEVDASGPS